MRSTIIGLSLTVCVVMLWATFSQGRQIGRLTGESERLQQALQTPQTTPSTESVTTASTATAANANNPSPELLKLRNQFAQLTRREKELAGVAKQNQQLHTQVAQLATNKSGAIPGVIRKADARKLGYTSPEAALETFLWAMQNRDVTNLLACFTPEISARMEQQFSQPDENREKMFKGFPPLRIVGREERSEDTVELLVEIMPGSGTEARPMEFKRINGEWKMNSN